MQLSAKAKGTEVASMFNKRQSVEAVSLALAVFFVVVLNLPFWRLFHQVVAPRSLYEWLFIAGVFVALLSLTYMIVMLLAVRPLLRPVLGVLLPVTAAASYFMLEYGAVIDQNMVRNMFETDSRGSRRSRVDEAHSSMCWRLECCLLYLIWLTRADRLAERQAG